MRIIQLCAILAILCTVPSSAQPRYTITDLSDGTNQFSLAYGMNGHGDAVGDANFHAFLWTDGTMITRFP